MANLDLGDPKAAGVRQDRDEPVQLAVDADLAQHLAAVELEPAIVIVEAAAAHAADHPVEDAAGIDLVPGIVAGLLPAADHVVSLFELGQEARNLGRVVLKIAVEREDQVAPGGLERGREGRRLAEVAPKPDRPHSRIAPGQCGQDGPRTVATAIIDENEFDWPSRAVGEHGIELAVQRGQAFFFIVDRDDDADHGQSGPVCRGGLTSDGGCRNQGKRIAAATSSAATQTSRNSSDAMTAWSEPIAGASVDISIPSRTPSPPGSTATTKPATVARATLAITTGTRPKTITASVPAGSNARTTASWLKPSKIQPHDDQSRPWNQEPAREARHRLRAHAGDRQADQSRQSAEYRGHGQHDKRQPQPSPPQAASR